MSSISNFSSISINSYCLLGGGFRYVAYSSVPNKRPGRLSLMRIFFPLKVSYRRFQGLDFYLKKFFPKWNFYQVYFIKQKSYPFINNFLNVRTQTIIQLQTIKFLLIYLCKDSYCVLPVYLAHQSDRPQLGEITKIIQYSRYFFK